MTSPVVPQIPAYPRHHSASYRRWAHVLLWLPVGLTVVGLVLSAILLSLADSSLDYQALGYLAIVVWGVLMLSSPVFIASFVSGLVMLSKSNKARKTHHAFNSHMPPIP